LRRFWSLGVSWALVFDAVVWSVTHSQWLLGLGGDASHAQLVA
jgi:hypothetical protein